MSLVNGKRIKKIIAREGLIIVGLFMVLYFLVSFFLQNVSVILPEYRLEFTDGNVYEISIFPEMRNDYNYRKLLEEAYSPSTKLIEKRIKEFIKAGNIKSTLKNSSYINSKQIYISKLYSQFLGVTFVLKLCIIYLVLLGIRLIIWALKAL